MPFDVHCQSARHAVFGGGATLSAAPSSMRIAAPPPERVHPATLFLVLAGAVLLAALVATLLGIPGEHLYDVDETGARNRPAGADPLALMRSIDANLKWIDEASGPGEASFGGLVRSINEREAAVATISRQLATMDGSVRAIDADLRQLRTTTVAVQRDLQAMEVASRQLATTTTALGGDLRSMSEAMADMVVASAELNRWMASLRVSVERLSTIRTPEARRLLKEINAILPPRIPEPELDSAPTTAAGVAPMTSAAGAAPATGAGEFARGAGSGAGAGTPPPGAQPPRVMGGAP